MSKLIKVNEVHFDTETEQPVLKLADGTTRVVNLVPTGNCWVEYWVTPEQLKQSEADAKERERKWHDEAKGSEQTRSKKKWWQL